MGQKEFKVVAASYSRVSSFDQITDTLKVKGSLEEQAAKAKVYIENQGWDYYGDYREEGISGEKFTERVALQRMIEDARQDKFQLVVIKTGDRLARDQEVYFKITKILNAYYNIQILNLSNPSQVVAPGDFNGRRNPMLIIQQGLDAMMGAFDQARRTEMLMEGKRRQIRAGRYISSLVFYGYRIEHRVLPNGQLERVPVPEPTQYPFLKMIPGWVIDERLSSTEIVMRLEALGARPQRSAHWNRVSVGGIIRQSFYAGKIEYGKTGTKLDHEGNSKGFLNRDPAKIILADHKYEHPWDWETYLQMQRIRAAKTVTAPRAAVSRSPLIGILKCGFCGHNMVFRLQSQHSTGHGRRSDRFRCGLHNTTPAVCQMNDVPANLIFEGIIEDIRKLKRQRDLDSQGFYAGLNKSDNENRSLELETHLQLARKELFETIPVKIDRLNRGYLNEKVTEDQYAELSRLIGQDQDRLNGLIRQLEGQLQKVRSHQTERETIDRFINDSDQYIKLFKLPVIYWPEYAPRKCRAWLAGRYSSITVKLLKDTDQGEVTISSPANGRTLARSLEIKYFSASNEVES